MPGKCFLCGDPAVESCGDCDQVCYCGKQAHLQVHKAEQTSNAGVAASCLPFRIDKVEGKGNVMVATRDIKAAEVS